MHSVDSAYALQNVVETLHIFNHDRQSYDKLNRCKSIDIIKYGG